MAADLAGQGQLLRFQVCFNLSGEIPQVAARSEAAPDLLAIQGFNLSGEIPQVAAWLCRTCAAESVKVSISQARFLKWPHDNGGAPGTGGNCFNLSGEIPQVAASR